MRISNNNNVQFGAVRVFPKQARNPDNAIRHVFQIMPMPRQVLGDNLTGAYFFDTLEDQKSYLKKLGKGIPFLETDHVFADLPKVRDTIEETFIQLAKKAGLSEHFCVKLD